MQLRQFENTVFDFEVTGRPFGGQVDRGDFKPAESRVEFDAVVRRLVGRVEADRRVDRRLAFAADLFPRHRRDERDRPQFVRCKVQFIAMCDQRRVAVIAVAFAAQGPMAPLGVVGGAVDIGGAGEQMGDGPLVDIANGKLTQSLRQIVTEGVIGSLAARDSDNCKGLWQQARGSEIVERGRQQTAGEISRSTENDEAARVGWPGYVCQNLVH